MQEDNNQMKLGGSPYVGYATSFIGGMKDDKENSNAHSSGM